MKTPEEFWLFAVQKNNRGRRTAAVQSAKNIKHLEMYKPAQFGRTSNPTAVDVFAQMRWQGLIAANYFPFQSRGTSARPHQRRTESTNGFTWGGRANKTHSPRHRNLGGAQLEPQDLRGRSWNIGDFIFLSEIQAHKSVIIQNSRINKQSSFTRGVCDWMFGLNLSHVSFFVWPLQ